MSIADHFEKAPDTGFIRNYDSNAARRQFHVSLMSIVVIAAAATALGLLVRIDIPTSSAVGLSNSSPSYVGKLQ